MASLKIEIPIDDATQWRTKDSDAVAKVKERLSMSPTKTPEDLAQELAAKNARTSLLQKLEIEARQSRARRANELVAENKARKIRIEAAAVARAASKIEKASQAKAAKHEEHSRKREASAARRAALFEAVRMQRQARQAAREARGKELSSLEDSAFALRQKKLQTTVDRTAAQVKHAIEVATSLKEKEKTVAAAAAARLAARLAAAEGRRQDVLSATVEGAASVTAAAEKVRLRHLHDEKAAVEERKIKLSQAMAKALGRRANAIDSIVTKAAKENSRVADVVSDTRHLTSTVKPAMLRHALASRMQTAQVNRLTNLKTKTLPASRDRSPAVTPLGTPADDVADVAKKATETPWASPAVKAPAAAAATDKTTPAATPKATSTVTATPTVTVTTQMRAFPKAPAVIVINTDDFVSVRRPSKPPTASLLNRLAFRPRMLLATAAARQAAAKGRRDTHQAILKARASHFSTTRVAVVRGRKAALTEYIRSIFELRATRATARAAAHLKATAAKAARMAGRATAAKLSRSSARLCTLNAAIVKEESRLAASERRSSALALRVGASDAEAFVVKVRRAAASERLASRGSALEKRGAEASTRREAILEAITFKARLMSSRKENLGTALVKTPTLKPSPKKPAAVSKKPAAVSKPAEKSVMAAEKEAEADKEMDEKEAEKENAEPAAMPATMPAAADVMDKDEATTTLPTITLPTITLPTTTPPTDFVLPISSLVAAAADVDKRIEATAATTEAKQRLVHQALTQFALLELGQGLQSDRQVRASYQTWKMLEERLLTVAAADGAALDEKVAAQRAEAIDKASRLSEMMAKRAEESAAGKRAAMAKAAAVQASVEELAAGAGLRGTEAKAKVGGKGSPSKGSPSKPPPSKGSPSKGAKGKAEEADGFVVVN